MSTGPAPEGHVSLTRLTTSCPLPHAAPPAAGAFFTFLLILASASLCLSSLFRVLAVGLPSPTMMQAVAGTFLLILVMTSGFAIVRQSIHPWWIWAYWLSPFSWALRSIAVNEFMTGGGAQLVGRQGLPRARRAAAQHLAGARTRWGKREGDDARSHTQPPASAGLPLTRPSPA